MEQRTTATMRSAMIVHDGGLAGLAACLAAQERGTERLVVWRPREGGVLAGTIGDGGTLGDVRAQMAVVGFEDVVEGGGAGDGVGSAGWPRRGHVGLARELLDVCGEAMERGLGRVIWPVFVGDDVDGLSAVTRVVQSVEGIVRLEAGVGGLRVETPFAEHSEAEMRAIAEEVGAARLLGAGGTAEVV